MAEIYSMTAFARESASVSGGELIAEVRTVNHRYLDCSFKLPEALRNAETRLRERAAARLSRGKLDCQFRFQAGGAQAATLEIDRARLQQVLGATTELRALLPDAQAVNPLELLQFPGVCATAAGRHCAIRGSTHQPVGKPRPGRGQDGGGDSRAPDAGGSRYPGHSAVGARPA